MCPARVFYVLNGEEKVEIFVGVIVDGKNGCYPLQAVYDLFGGFKNLFMTKTIVHTYFQRMNPYKVSHEFSDEELELFGTQIATYMTLKSPLEEKEGLYIFRSPVKMNIFFCIFIYTYTEEIKRLRRLSEAQALKIEQLTAAAKDISNDD